VANGFRQGITSEVSADLTSEVGELAKFCLFQKEGNLIEEFEGLPSVALAKEGGEDLI
jgi:hypothetical protein